MIDAKTEFRPLLRPAYSRDRDVPVHHTDPAALLAEEERQIRHQTVCADTADTWTGTSGHVCGEIDSTS